MFTKTRGMYSIGRQPFDTIQRHIAYTIDVTSVFFLVLQYTILIS